MVGFRWKWVYEIAIFLVCLVAGLLLVAGAASQEKKDRIVYVYSDSCGYCNKSRGSSASMMLRRVVKISREKMR